MASTLDHLESEASHLGLHVSWQKTKLQNLDGMTGADDSQSGVIQWRPWTNLFTSVVCRLATVAVSQTSRAALA